MKLASSLLTAFALLLGKGPSDALAQCTLTKLIPGEMTENPELGYSVATDGIHAVSGAPRDATLGTDAGAAYVSRRTGVAWTEAVMLLPSDGAEFDSFGTAVAVHGDYLVIGSPADDGPTAINRGAVYVFKRTGPDWIQQAKIFIPNGLEDDEFGLSVALDGDLLAAGARTDTHGTSSGSVYVFRRNGAIWHLEDKLTAADAAEGDQFGLSVSISGNAVVVGARHNDTSGGDAGAAYIFRNMGAGWAQEMRLLADEAQPGDEFGISVAIDGDYVAVGARLVEIDTKNNAGAVYIFHRKGGAWVQEARFGASDADMNDQFGVSVGLSGNHLIVGAWQDADAGRNTGAAYAFERKGTAWTETLKLTNGRPASLDEYGFAVSAGGNFAVAGIPGDDGIGLRSGSADVYAIGGDCNHNGLPDVCDILEGISLDANNDGIPDECPQYGDFDSDGDIDLFDLGRFQNCFRGTDALLPAGCTLADVEPDDDVDLTDYAQIGQEITGP